MPRSALRLVLGLLTVGALAVIGFVVFRQRSGISVAAPDSAPAVSAAASNAVTSTSGPGEWAMEGYDPARTRSSKSSIALPVDRQRVMPIAGDKGIGSPVAIAQDVLLVEVGHQLRAVDIKTGKQ